MRKLGRKIGHRKSLMRNLSASLVLYEKIDTTLAKAKDTRSQVEKIINISKGQDLKSYRRLLDYFYDKNAAKKVYDELSKRYKDRSSGYIKLFHLGPRLGDNSKMARLELIDRKVFVADTKLDEDKIKKVDSSNVELVEKLDRKEQKIQKNIKRLSTTSQKAGITTKIRSKAARKTGV